MNALKKLYFSGALGWVTLIINYSLYYAYDFTLEGSFIKTVVALGSIVFLVVSSLCGSLSLGNITILIKELVCKEREVKNTIFYLISNFLVVTANIYILYKIYDTIRWL